MEQKARNGNRNAQTVIELLREPEDFLSAIQVGITLIGIVSGAYGGAALSDDAREWMQRVPFLAPYADTLSLVLVIGLITYFTIVIGELIPKTLALGNASGIALAVAPVVKVFTLLTMPLVKLLGGSTSLVIGLFGIRKPAEERLSEEEIRQIIKTAGRQGVLAREESELHQNLFTYADERASNLMTRRMDVEWLDSREPVERIQEALQASAHSKFPVIGDSPDDVVGVLESRRFYEYLLTDRREPWTSILQPPIYIPETMLAHAVLNTFKRQRQYMGLVLDEYGSVEGIITLHDLLEAIVGDLPDPDEPDEPSIIRRADGSLLVSGSVSVRELNQELGQEVLALERGYTTLAGFIISHLERFPEVGEKFIYNGLVLEVVDMDGAKVDKVIVYTAKDGEAES